LGTVCLTRSIDFSASLQLRRGDLSDAENERLFGPLCARHGHNYHREVTLRGEPDPVTGMVLDLAELKAVLESEIMDRFDHRDLNTDTPYFEKEPPTPENFARVIHRLLSAALPDGMLDRIHLQPEADLWVEIAEPKGAP